ncbi:MAG: recombinase family protein [Paludibacter sp.]|nr:recombinase family protein [Paludibacter sp.]
MENKKVYGYVRVSTDTQSEKGYGLDTQRQAIEKYCMDNSLELLETFEDKGISGTEAIENDGDELISKRKGLLQLLSVLNGTNTIVVLNTSRLWRSDIAKVLIRREIERKHGEVISIEQPRYSIYKKDPSEVLINGMFELLDEYERISIALKLAKGRTTKANKGDKPAGVTPYGYKYSENKKSVVVDEGEAATVKRMYSLSQTGKTLQQIVDMLNSEGIVTRQGNAWTKGTVHGMLRNDFYTGVLSHQQTSIKGNHEAIISKVQFGKVQKQLERRHK